MKILEQLDTQVTILLQKLNQLQAENTRLRSQLDIMRESLAALEEHNHSLTDALAQEAAIRTKALQHIDRLIEKIRDYE